MEHYQGFFLKEKLGNNAFTYELRWPNAQLRVPKLILGTTKDLKIWSKPAFSECDESWKVKEYLGLEYFIKLNNSSNPIYIFDNHNHALYFRYKELRNWDITKWKQDKIALIHIDQHSDLNQNTNTLPETNLDDIFNFVQTKCNVGNFIEPALKANLISHIDQIRSEYKLLNYQNIHKNYILDIDLDFRAEEMSIKQFDETIKKTKNLILNAKVVTIATSPYFLPQEKAIQLLHILLD